MSIRNIQEDKRRLEYSGLNQHAIRINLIQRSTSIINNNAYVCVCISSTKENAKHVIFGSSEIVG